MKRLAHYSQYFLRSPQLVKELVGHTNIRHHDIVYDIGAGSGIVSAVLAERCHSVVAIEAEARVATKLRTNMQQYHNVTVLQADFISMPLPEKKYKVFANIPFHLSSPIVRKLTQTMNPPEAAYLIVQKQFAHKLLPDSDGFTSQLGMLIGPEFAVRIRRRLKRTDFWPHPNVDTVLLEMIHRPEPLLPRAVLPDYELFTVNCFSDPKFFVRFALNSHTTTSKKKPSQFTLDEWLQLFKQKR